MKRKISQEEEQEKEQKLKDLDLSGLPHEIVEEIFHNQQNSMVQWMKLRMMGDRNLNKYLEDPLLIKRVQWKVNVPLITEENKDTMKVPNYFKDIEKIDISFNTLNGKAYPLDNNGNITFGTVPKLQVKTILNQENLQKINHLIVRIETGDRFHSMLTLLENTKMFSNLSTLEMYGKTPSSYNICTGSEKLKKIMICPDYDLVKSFSVAGEQIFGNEYLPSEIMIDCSKNKIMGYDPPFMNIQIHSQRKIRIEKLTIFVNPNTFEIQGLICDVNHVKMENCISDCNFQRIETLELTNCFFKKSRRIGLSIITHIVLNDLDVLTPTEEYYSFDWFINYCQQQQIEFDIKKVSYHRNALSENSNRILKRRGVECILLPKKPTIQIQETKGKKETIKKTIPSNHIEKSIENIKNMNKKMEEMILSHPNTFELLAKIKSK